DSNRIAKQSFRFGMFLLFFYTSSNYISDIILSNIFEKQNTNKKGTLQSVDCYMNMELIDTLVWSLDSWIINKLEANETIKTNADEETVIETDKLPDSKWLSEQTRADYLFLKGCRLRYFFLPETVNVFDCIEKQLKVYRSRRNDSDDRHQQRPFNWKCYRKRLKLIQKQNLSESSTTDA
ncbi:hypothetical protein SSS_10140, partial [Sarcoptes scabiei]